MGGVLEYIGAFINGKLGKVCLVGGPENMSFSFFE